MAIIKIPGLNEYFHKHYKPRTKPYETPKKGETARLLSKIYLIKPGEFTYESTKSNNMKKYKVIRNSLHWIGLYAGMTFEVENAEYFRSGDYDRQLSDSYKINVDGITDISEKRDAIIKMIKYLLKYEPDYFEEVIEQYTEDQVKEFAYLYGYNAITRKLTGKNVDDNYIHELFADWKKERKL